MRGSSPTHRLVRRLAGTVAATGLALAGLVAAAAPASAAACSGTSGVTVVVDTGGSISTRCASGDPSTAWKALTAAGFGTTPVQTFPGALCQINGYPDTSCVRMPPASAYWAFFHAKAGGSWTYQGDLEARGHHAEDVDLGIHEGHRFHPEVRIGRHHGVGEADRHADGDGIRDSQPDGIRQLLGEPERAGDAERRGVRDLPGRGSHLRRRRRVIRPRHAPRRRCARRARGRRRRLGRVETARLTR